MGNVPYVLMKIAVYLHWRLLASKWRPPGATGRIASPGFPRPSGFGHPGLCLSSPLGCFRSGCVMVFPFFPNVGLVVC